MPPRSVLLNVFTNVHGWGKESGVHETVEEVAHNGVESRRGSEQSDKGSNEAQRVAACAAVEAPTSTCAVCQNSAASNRSPLLRCSRCRGAFYCNTTCQKADWKAHRKLCRPRRTDSAHGSTPSTTSSTPTALSPSEYETSNFAASPSST
ncbi:hypothetical protein EJ04DRAFT_522505 [Polyplosphaeria fusca]|uniref:MYND-type domain-containing protein n=1 Tax=Polyplosphaeria fusca TaxID=682080 RepID=A0A9P4V508_9PLEO|nr:hypothetical protein EJ04DRAFT_522505 [Polyplosphaeria fusca]